MLGGLGTFSKRYDFWRTTLGGNLTRMGSTHLDSLGRILGPRGPLGLPSLVRPQEKSGSAVELYKSSQDHYQPIRHCLVHVWWCLVVSGLCLVVSVACLVVSGGVNVYGQI